MDEKGKILDRVIIFSESLGNSLRSFSLSIGASPGYLHRLQSTKSNIGGDFIEKIIESYPQLNPVWLITGEGRMLKNSYEANEAQTAYGNRDFFKEALLNYLDDSDVQDKVIQAVSKQNIVYKQNDKKEE
ncbi:hypothetical protein [Aquimarina sp. 2201CG5-10]|uniref:hypothetical protein n=1 Tax=Aquimarina callyspongiae TaxID=3098150 RepID=UPI002AB54C01|nr:hypothetical protein [Aquimarina sp. 2201CG5-10]MDY8134496.1 hypothetical protein [Aquimarina sp. 2201CG5-10]